MFRFNSRQLCQTFIAAALLQHTTARPQSQSADSSDTTTPSPISVPPAENWDGIDGQWSPFTLRIGNPAQYVRVFAATNSQQIWAVDASACSADSSTETACIDSRGWSFNASSSTSWIENGWYELGIEENLGYRGNGFYGYEDVGLSDDASGLPLIKNTTVGTFQSEDFWLGIFGLHPKPTNFSSFNERSPSPMTTLKENGYIPSLSYGYTAGNQYRFTKVPASLTLGGFDASRFIDNGISFPFAPDNERDLVVALQKITAADSAAELLPTPSYMFIDSTVSEIWLPLDACERFEDEFGLVYDEASGLYLVDDTVNNSLLSRNANVTFTIGPQINGGSTVDITFPYAAFNLIAKRPYRQIASDANYFPLRRAANATQYTLGRTFLQEAYIVVNHELGNFSLSQCDWKLSEPANIVRIFADGTIDGATSGSTTPDSGSNTNLIIGVVVGVVGGILVTAIVAFFLWRRWKKKQLSKFRAEANAAVLAGKSSPSDDSTDSGGSTNVATTESYAKPELPADTASSAQLDDDTTLDGGTLRNGEIVFKAPVEADADELQIYEMPGSMPEVEKDGRQYTEKEALVHRERIFNGTDPEPAPSPLLPEYSAPTHTNERRQLTMLDVAPIVGTGRPLTGRSADRGLVSPLTPGFPSPRDGRTLASSDGSRTLGSGISSGEEPRRKRFSFEEPTDDEKTLPRE